MKRMSDLTNVEGVTAGALDEEPEEDPGEITLARRRGARVVEGRLIPRGVEIFEVNGPFFFGAAEKLRDVMSVIAKPPAALVLRMRNVPTVDATGIHALKQMARRCHGQGITMILAETRPQPLRALERARVLDAFGSARNIVPSLDDALARARELLGP